MEFEIINEMLTSTVSKLFSNNTRHLSYFVLEEESMKSDIPKSKQIILPNLGSNRKEEQYASNKFNSNTGNTSKGNNTTNLYENLKNYDSQKRLEEALKRLNVDEQRCKNKNLVNLGMDFLVAEKNKVKSELKKFDTEFFEMFQKYPNRNEKEIMRILYMYYKNLKQAITYKQENSTKNNSHNTSNSKDNKDSAVNNKVSSNNKTGDVQLVNNFTAGGKKKEDPTSQGSNNNQININSLYNLNTNPNPSILNFNNIYSLNDNTELIQQEQQQNSSTIKEKEKKSKNQNLYSNLLSQNNNNVQVNQVSNKTLTSTLNNNSQTNQNKKNYSSNPNSSASNKKGNDLIDMENTTNVKTQSHPLRDKKLTKADLIILEKEYEGFKKEQVDLKQRLHNYQKEFFEIHNRRVKYYKDIIGVEDEYQKYKENKNKMKEIQDILMLYKNSKKKEG